MSSCSRFVTRACYVNFLCFDSIFFSYWTFYMSFNVIFLISIKFFLNSYSIWHYILIHARFYSLQERLRLDIFFLSFSSFSFNLEFLLQRERYALRVTHFFFFNLEIVTILNCFSNSISIIIRIVDMMFFRVSKILIVFVVLIFLFNRIYRFRQFEHANNIYRIVMTSWLHE